MSLSCFWLMILANQKKMRCAWNVRLDLLNNKFKVLTSLTLTSKPLRYGTVRPLPLYRPLYRPLPLYRPTRQEPTAPRAMTVRQRCDSVQQAFQACGTTGVLCGAIAVRQACKWLILHAGCTAVTVRHACVSVRKAVSEAQQPCDFECKCVRTLCYSVQ